MEEAAQDHQVGVGGVARQFWRRGDPGKVVLEDFAGDAAGTGDLGMLLGQEGREPAQGPLVDADRPESLPRAEPVAAGTFDGLAQPVLGEAVEADLVELRRGARSKYRPAPDVPGELGLSVGVLGEVTQMPPAVAQLAHGAAAGVGKAVMMGQHRPARQVMIEQRGHPRRGEELDQPVDHHRDQPDRAFVVAALDGVGDLKPDLQRQAAQVKRVGAVRSARKEAGSRGVLVDVRAAAVAPSAVVTVAQHPSPRATLAAGDLAAPSGEDWVVRVGVDQLCGEPRADRHHQLAQQCRPGCRDRRQSGRHRVAPVLATPSADHTPARTSSARTSSTPRWM